MGKKIGSALIILFLVAMFVGAGLARYIAQNGGVEKVIVQNVARTFVHNPAEQSLFQKALGYGGTRTYLVLFLNNTELRPGGGFIGAYGIVRFENGIPRIEKIEGTEILDNEAPATAALTPPEPLAKYLFIKRWQFRDSNWSPDFPTAASTSLYLYRLEKGIAADEVDGVIAITPSVLEELLTITGPVKVGDATFTSENATEQLEYAVEYGYANAGHTYRDRKETLVQLSHALFEKIRFDIFSHWSAYAGLAPQLLASKQVLFYSTHADEQRIIEQSGWGGALPNSTIDFVLWADANLGALKTDASLQRDLTYTITPTTSGYIAAVTMHYNHRGVFDWRTTRYLDYARVFAPTGSTLVQVEGGQDGGSGARIETILQGVENNFSWFGGFIKIEPGHTGHLTFVYRVSPTVVEAIRAGKYRLTVQKQAGTPPEQLTLGLDFGTKVTAANPAEASEKFGDNVYDITTSLDTDKVFTVGL